MLQFKVISSLSPVHSLSSHFRAQHRSGHSGKQRASVLKELPPWNCGQSTIGNTRRGEKQ